MSSDTRAPWATPEAMSRPRVSEPMSVPEVSGGANGRVTMSHGLVG